MTLPRATIEMNCFSDSFESRVVEIISGEDNSIVIVELDGSYPYITNKWESFILPLG